MGYLNVGDKVRIRVGCKDIEATEKYSECYFPYEMKRWEGSEVIIKYKFSGNKINNRYKVSDLNGNESPYAWAIDWLEKDDKICISDEIWEI